MDVEIHLLIGSFLILSLAFVLAVVRHADILVELLPSYKFKQKSFKKERRIHPRYKTSLNIKYNTPTEQGISLIGDISRGGLRLLSADKAFKIGGLLHLEINLPNDLRPIFVQGNIAWMKKGEAGLSFNEVQQDDISRIIQHTGNTEQIISVKKYQFI